VFQEIQNSIGQPILREVMISLGRDRHMMVDGLVEGSPATIIEIVNSRLTSESMTKLSNAIMRLDHIATEVKLNSGHDLKAIVAVLTAQAAQSPPAQGKTEIAAI
jgi:hypothetical protein